MDSIFYKKSDEFIIVYINDILVFSKSKEVHKLHLEVFLKKLRNNQYYVNVEKIIFFLEELEFLGHFINGEELIQNSKKIEAIKI